MRTHSDRQMARKLTIEEAVLLRMRLLTSWINFWVEDREDPELEWSESTEFGVTQIEDLQRCLERLKVKLKREQN